MTPVAGATAPEGTGSLPAPIPAVNPETREFWAATAAGRLLLKRCLDCGSVIWSNVSVSMNT